MGKKNSKITKAQKAAEKKQFMIIGGVVIALLALIFYSIG